MNLANKIIDSVDWARVSVLSGQASEYSTWLRRLIEASDPEVFPEIWSHIENSVFAQDDIFSAAEPTIQVLFAALLDDTSEVARYYVLDLLFLIGSPAFGGTSDLAQRCARELESGAWLLVRTALAGSENVRNACLEVLDLYSLSCASLVRSVDDY